MKRKFKIQTTILVVFLLFTLSINETLPQAVTNIQEEFRPVITADPEIIIDEDSDFLAYPGHGNSSHPYLIQGYDIQSLDYDVELWDEPYANCITVANTTKHFIIQNNYLLNGWSGIKIESVAPGTAKVINNTIEESLHSIYLKNVTGALIDDNYVNNIFLNNGILLDHCYDSNITNNRVYRLIFNAYYITATFEMIRLVSCSGIDIINNEFSHCVQTILKIESSSDLLVQDNYIHDCYYASLARGYAAISLHGVTNSIFHNNTIENYLQTSSLYASGCNSLLFNENDISASDDMGINLKQTTNCNLTWNKITDHPGYAIVLWSDTSNTIIYHNNFEDNNLGGTSQAYDDGSNNVWYDTSTNEGNWWKYDWSGGPYSIYGTAGSVDPYPLGIPIPEFYTTSVLLILGIPLFSVLVIVLKKKRI